VTCKVKPAKKSKVKVTCTVTFKAAGAVRARLSRSGHTVARATARRGLLRFRIARRLTKGRYVLTTVNRAGRTTRVAVRVR
jgi:hypothetical protein